MVDTAYIFFVPKDAQYSETDFLVPEFVFVAIFSFSDMVDFVFNNRSELGMILKTFTYNSKTFVFKIIYLCNGI